MVLMIQEAKFQKPINFFRRFSTYHTILVIRKYKILKKKKKHLKRIENQMNDVFCTECIIINIK